MDSRLRPSASLMRVINTRFPFALCPCSLSHCVAPPHVRSCGLPSSNIYTAFNLDRLIFYNAPALAARLTACPARFHVRGVRHEGHQRASLERNQAARPVEEIARGYTV